METEIETPKPIPLARLVFHVLEDRTAVIAVTPDGKLQGYDAALGRGQLTAQISKLRRALNVEVDPRDVDIGLEVTSIPEIELPKDLLKEIYAELIAPLEKILPSDGTPVVIEPHGSLWLLPFAALLTSDDTYLADHWPLLYSPSSQVLEEIRSEPDYGGPKDLKPLVVGNPTMPSVANRNGIQTHLPPLPGAEKECTLIYDLFSDTEGGLLLGEAAD